MPQQALGRRTWNLDALELERVYNVFGEGGFKVP